MEGYPHSDAARPTGAFVASIVGAVLMLVEGVYLSVVGSVASGAGLVAAGSLLGGLGFLGAFFGFIVLILSILLFRNPDSHTGYGIAILVLSLLSIFGGGGFIIGLIVGAIGGILAIVFQPDGAPLPLGPDLPSVAKTGSRCPNCGAAIFPGERNCPKCEAPAYP